MIKHCKDCGVEFEAENNYKKLCPACYAKNMEHRRIRNMERMREYAKERGLASTKLYKEDLAKIKAIKPKDLTIADYIKKLLRAQ